MKTKIVVLLSTLALLATGFFLFSNATNHQIIAYTVDLKKQDVQLYWKDDNNEILKSIQRLKTHVEHQNKTLLFAMNGGMYTPAFTPQGLYIQNSNILTAIDTTSGNGNFYLKPNGVFYITTDTLPYICKTADFVAKANVTYATQSGPMLVIDGQIHPAFKKNSKNLNIRNGVGILPDNKVVFAMSKTEVNFYEFATYFQKRGCINALFLDGFVSRTYCPSENWIQTDGNFGVMIGITQKIKYK